ncbi:MAG: DUF1854 domain-containing protein [Burkholderiaceae bacterium]|nr:DUF1854 domain-containing protein [Burkholderiales bacterium]MCZ8104461.1 DUF1854 domain-containing protein [Burkholderiales bacterium]MCZ8338614.1 DUF1854 domain-containing protein [Burkholderiaceae bacterium]
MAEFSLSRDPFGRLVLRDAAGAEHVGVVPVRAFPIGAPDEGLSLVSVDGHELAWIERLDALDAARRVLVEEDLASREFVPEIRAIRAVSSFATPSTWTVDTDRGPTSLVLKGEEDIRRLGRTSLLIADRHGIQFLVRDIGTLDRSSRKLLDRFL